MIKADIQPVRRGDLPPKQSWSQSRSANPFDPITRNGVPAVSKTVASLGASFPFGRNLPNQALQPDRKAIARRAFNIADSFKPLDVSLHSVAARL
jgi:hypothetical protein